VEWTVNKIVLELSGNNRNVRISAPVEMSGVGTLSLLPLERLSPRMIFGWTPALAAAILRRAVGRIGLRRRAPRAPADGCTPVGSTATGLPAPSDSVTLLLAAARWPY
jgi:hypothetical protein